jgi:hypothetical protein
VCLSLKFSSANCIRRVSKVVSRRMAKRDAVLLGDRSRRITTHHNASQRITTHHNGITIRHDPSRHIKMPPQTHLVAVDRLAASAIPLGKVSTLRPVTHQSPDNTCLNPHELALTHMKFLMMRWNELPSYPNPSSSPSRVLPVASARKFSAVLGTVLRSQRGVTLRGGSRARGARRKKYARCGYVW